MHSLPTLLLLPPPTSWNFDPAILIVSALLLAAYFIVVGPLRARYSEEATSRARNIYFVVGMLSLLLTLCSPLDTLGRYYLLTAHTLQLFILITVTAPFLLMGLPEWLVTLLLPLQALRNATRGLLFPVLAALVFNAIIMLWHDPPLYEQALHDNTTHNLQMLSFLVAGILTWWPLLTPMDHHTRMATPIQMAYLAIESLPLDIFGVIMIFGQSVFYPTYEAAPRLFGLSAIVDQQIAGGLLAVPGNLLDIILLSVVFFIWIERQEREQRAREREQYAQEDEEAAARDEGASLPAEAPTPNVGV